MRRLTHWLFRSRVIVVQFSAQQIEPVLEFQHAVVHEITRTGFNQERALVRQVLGQPRRNHAAGRAAANNHIVVAVDVAGGEERGRHDGYKGTISGSTWSESDRAGIVSSAQVFSKLWRRI